MRDSRPRHHRRFYQFWFFLVGLAEQVHALAVVPHRSPMDPYSSYSTRVSGKRVLNVNLYRVPGHLEERFIRSPGPPGQSDLSLVSELEIDGDGDVGAVAARKHEVVDPGVGPEAHRIPSTNQLPNQHGQ